MPVLMWLYWEVIDSWMDFARDGFSKGSSISKRVVTLSREKLAKFLLDYDHNRN